MLSFTFEFRNFVFEIILMRGILKCRMIMSSFDIFRRIIVLCSAICMHQCIPYRHQIYGKTDFISHVCPLQTMSRLTGDCSPLEIRKPVLGAGQLYSKQVAPVTCEENQQDGLQTSESGPENLIATGHHIPH